MLTEEQIQRLAKKIADEHGRGEEESKELVRSMVNYCSVVVNSLCPEHKKVFEGEFFENLIQSCVRLGKEISKICRDTKALFEP